MDIVGWKLQPDLPFSVKTAYIVRCGAMVGENEALWKVIHKFQGLQRIKIFLWLLCKNKIMTNAERARRHSIGDDRCPLCLSSLEYVNHLFQRCASR
ncbi:hypothetical protein V6N12_050779 [Hibiscus sabdariffa]|uniref:Reverse transcriptase zinc-binding domain-containing protein n=1 Tax=Hibiscus sabdariffa TaxID=183260 RepID=A0ABR2GF56_9ROSI